MTRTFYSNGKLLLSGEYVVLDGALSLAIPTKFGQSLKVETIEEPKIYWKSLDEKGTVWFEETFEINNIVTLKNALSVKSESISNRLFQIFQAIQQLKPNFFNVKNGYRITTTLDFTRDWGLGTSSTLINNMAQWANVNAFKLLELTFGGSGYDIACAQNNTPITYQIKDSLPFVKQVAFNPSFRDHLYFLHLNKKQNSRDGIAHYKTQNKEHIGHVINEINNITHKLISCESLDVFEVLINQHENIIGKITQQTPVKELLFNDFKGSIKSLGAWGGDFVLIACKDSPIDYFNKKGFETIISYSNMVL